MRMMQNRNKSEKQKSHFDMKNVICVLHFESEISYFQILRTLNTALFAEEDVLVDFPGVGRAFYCTLFLLMYFPYI
jgi:hypothetical protein